MSNSLILCPILYTIITNYYKGADMKYKLGLDLGSTSLGWAVVELGDNDEILRLVDMGVRIFPDGQEHSPTGVKSLASVRSEKKQQRLQTDRRKMRRKQLFSKLVETGLLPTDKEMLKELLNPGIGNGNRTNPYELRNKAVEEQVSLYELGRILWHLSKHRGFSGKRDQDIDIQSTKQQVEPSETDNAKEAKNVNKRIERLRHEIASAGVKTLGQYLHKKYEENKSVRFTALEASTGQSSGFPSRKLYQEEFETIWKKQEKYYPNILNEQLKKELRDDIMYFQRPLAQQPVGKCKFEKSEDRIAKCYPLYQEYRILQDINDLELDGTPLPDEYRMAIYHMLMNPNAVDEMIDGNGRLSFDKIREHLNIIGRFNLEYIGNRGLLCNKTNKVMSSDAVFGDKWFDFDAETQEKIIYEITAYHKTKNQSKEALQEMGIKDDALIERLLKKHSLLTKGYSELSAMAIKRVLPAMKNGKKWHEAAAEKYGKHTVVRPYYTFGYNPPKQLPDYRKLFHESLTNGKIGNVTVHIGLNQLRAVVNALIERYGHPYSIAIEMARELKMGKKALDIYRRKQWQNQKFNIDARRKINDALGRSYDSAVSSGEMERYKVWYNLNPKNENQRYDWYDSSDTPLISLRDALSSEYEIEHIIPRSIGGDDTWANKILTRKDHNLAKGNMLPYQYLSESQLARAKRWAKDSDDVRKTESQRKEEEKAIRAGKPVPFVFNSFAWRFESNAGSHINKDFKSRDLNDTRYLCKVARDYLSYICVGYSHAEKQRTPYVIASNGTMTSLFKDIWELNDCLPYDYDKWSIQDWQRDIMKQRIFERLFKDDPEFGVYDKEKTASKAKQDAEKKQIEEELKNTPDSEFLKISSRKKDRTNHYHHALDAFVIACLDNKMVQEINVRANEFADMRDKWNRQNDADKEKSLQQIRKEQIQKEYTKPFGGFDKNLLAKTLADLVVAEKQQPDKLQQYLSGKSKGVASFTQDTAFGIADEEYFDDGYIMLRVNGKTSKADLKTLVPVFNKQHPEYKRLKQQYIDAYAQWRTDKKDRQKIRNLMTCISRDKVFKWLASGGNYATEIYTNGKSAVWSTDIMSNWWALQRGGRFWWRDDYPNGKCIMKLRIGSKIRVMHENATLLKEQRNIGNWVISQIEHGRDLLFRVKKLTGTNIYLTPVHVALEKPDDTKTWQASARSLQKVSAQIVEISVLGDVVELK